MTICDAVRRSHDDLTRSAYSLEREGDAALRPLADAVRDHMRGCRVTLYPALLARGRYAHLVYESMEQFATLSLLLCEVESLPEGDGRRAASLPTIRALVCHAVRDEREVLLPYAEAILTPTERRALGERHGRLLSLAAVSHELCAMLRSSRGGSRTGAPPSRKRLH